MIRERMLADGFASEEDFLQPGSAADEDLRLEGGPYDLDRDYCVGLGLCAPKDLNLQADALACCEDARRYHLEIELLLLRATFDVIGYDLVKVEPSARRARLKARRTEMCGEILDRFWLRGA